jgi:hypothetical protein
VKEVRKRLISASVEMVDLGSEKTDEGIVMRTGARGKIRSVYCRDPDGNLIECVALFFLILRLFTRFKLMRTSCRVSNYI